MGLFTKKEKYNPETERFEPVPRKPLFQRGEIESKPLIHEEQVEPQRVHPWQTEHGKKLVHGAKRTVGRFDRAVVSYNRTRNPMRSRGPSRSSPSYNNYNPFGSTFDTGMKPMKKPKSKNKNYIIRGGKAYPIAGTGKKKHKKKSKSKHGRDAFSMDYGSWGW